MGEKKQPARAKSTEVVECVALEVWRHGRFFSF